MPTIRRSKLYSLRFLNPKAFEVEEIRSTNKDVFKKLEKSLERDNKEEQPLAEPTPILPD